MMAPRKRKAVDEGGGGERKMAAGISTRITRNMTTDGPRQAVFNTAELLEQILLYLPVKTVFVCQRVSRQFRDVVSKSAAVRQKLFLQPSKGDPATVWVHATSLSVEHFWGAPEDLHWTVRDLFHIEQTDGNIKTYIPIRLNPLLGVQDRVTTWGSSAIRLWNGPPRESTKIQMDLPLQSQASWREMYLSDPPCKSINFRAKWRYGRSPKVEGFHNCELRDPDGITLGAVMDGSVHKKGEVSYKSGRVWVNEGDTTLHDVLQGLGESSRKRAYIDSQHSILFLDGMVVPTEEEWDSVK